MGLTCFDIIKRLFKFIFSNVFAAISPRIGNTFLFIAVNLEIQLTVKHFNIILPGIFCKASGGLYLPDHLDGVNMFFSIQIVNVLYMNLCF